MMISYPVRLGSGKGGRVTLSFPDVPEAVVVGTSEDAVFEEALTELERALAGYIGTGRPVPRPSDICGAPQVTTYRFRIDDEENLGR